jgi:hypothetical protein
MLSDFILLIIMLLASSLRKGTAIWGAIWGGGRWGWWGREGRGSVGLGFDKLIDVGYKGTCFVAGHHSHRVNPIPYSCPIPHA